MRLPREIVGMLPCSSNGARRLSVQTAVPGDEFKSNNLNSLRWPSVDERAHRRRLIPSLQNEFDGQTVAATCDEGHACDGFGNNGPIRLQGAPARRSSSSSRTGEQHAAAVPAQHHWLRRVPSRSVIGTA